MKRFYWILIVLMAACSARQPADLLIHNANIYTVNANNDRVNALVVKDGKILFAGDQKEALRLYSCTEERDLEGAFVYPGFNDAHAHFYGLGRYAQMVDLTGTKSWTEVLERCKDFYNTHQPPVLTGRGWDQNDWVVKEYPDNEELNRLFPVPVMLKRVDGHAAIVNSEVLKMARLNGHSVIEGGALLKRAGRLSGVLIDNAVDSVEKIWPEANLPEMISALVESEKICFRYGLTSVCDAGLDRKVIGIIDSLQRSGTLHIRVYAMISVSDENIEYYIGRQPYITDRLNVSSFKMYCDGALGSRGACLISPYSDQPAYHGLMLTPLKKMEEYAGRIAASLYQLNTHCIGDSANRFILDLYARHPGKEGRDRRWRIEHAQVVHEDDFDRFGQYGIVPSVQPTHATSDMYWAGKRLGNERVKNAYAFKRLLKQNGWIPLGTDFPVESPNPLYTFYAAVARKDAEGFPPGGFQAEEALSREEALRGITLWAAKAAFEEDKKGSLEAGKFADFVVMDTDLLKDDLNKIREARIKATYLGGIRVYE